MRLSDYTITRFQFARDRVIGDSQVRATGYHVGVLELHTAEGLTGTGFFFALFHALPSLAEIRRLFEQEVWPGLKDQHPSILLNRLRRPRGGNIRPFSLPFEQGIDQALWDLQGKHLGLPLWRLLGGTEGKVPAYASGLDYHLSDEDYVSFFRQASEQGYTAFKIKVGHPDIEWDLHRLKLLKQAVGDNPTIMVDSNEDWSPKEAIRRLKLYMKAGHEILWAEDPCLRDDFVGLREIREAVPEVMVNSGEYLGLRDKRKLIEARAVDLLNVHGVINDVMKAGWLAAEHGLEVTLGNTSFEIGVHMACALPECRWLEYSFQNGNTLMAEPVRIEAGWAHAPDRPGHGLALADWARKDLARADVLAPDELPAGPPGPIRLSSAALTANRSV